MPKSENSDTLGIYSGWLPISLH